MRGEQTKTERIISAKINQHSANMRSFHLIAATFFMNVVIFSSNQLTDLFYFKILFSCFSHQTYKVRTGRANKRLGYISFSVAAFDCVRTVEALLVDYGAAGQGFVVLLVAHQGVHTQDGWKTARRLNENGKKQCVRTRWEKDTQKENGMLKTVRRLYCGTTCYDWQSAEASQASPTWLCQKAAGCCEVLVEAGWTDLFTSFGVCCPITDQCDTSPAAAQL